MNRLGPRQIDTAWDVWEVRPRGGKDAPVYVDTVSRSGAKVWAGTRLGLPGSYYCRPVQRWTLHIGTTIHVADFTDGWDPIKTQEQVVPGAGAGLTIISDG